MIQNLLFGILFLKISFRAYNFLVFYRKFQWTLSEIFSISDCLTESLKADKNWRKRSLILQYSFAQKTLLILRTSTHLTLENICSKYTAKNLSHFTNFPANIFLLAVKKKHLYCTISWRPRTAFLKHFESKGQYIFVYLHKRFFSWIQKRNKILSGGEWINTMNNFFKTARCVCPAKCFTIFHFNWNFLKIIYFSAFRYFHLQH